MFNHLQMFRALTLALSLLILNATAAFSSDRAATGCERLADGPPRGLMCLHCMYRPALPGVEDYTDSLLNACRKKVALSFITDGTWGYDESMIRTQVQKFLDAGREVHLQFYIVNGPAQRRWTTRIFKAWSVMEPRTFERSLMQRKSRLRSTFISELEKLKPLIEDVQASGVRVTIVPALEDNFTNPGFNAAAKIIRGVFPLRSRVGIVRNACGDCYPGNQSGVPRGVITELHPPVTGFSLSNGIISFDGSFFDFSYGGSSSGVDNPDPRQNFTNAQVKEQVRQASARNNTYYLWVAKYQGITKVRDTTPLHLRNFPFPTESEVREIADILGQ